MTGYSNHLEAHLDLPIHNRRVDKDGNVIGEIVETHYAILERIKIHSGEDWLSVVCDTGGHDTETRIPIKMLEQFFGVELNK